MKIFKIIPKRRWALAVALALANRSIFQPKEATNCCLLPLPSNVHHNQRPSSASACSGCRVLTRHTHRHGGYCTPTANSNHLLLPPPPPAYLAGKLRLAWGHFWHCPPPALAASNFSSPAHQRHMGTAPAQTRRLTEAEAEAEAEAVPVPRSRPRTIFETVWLLVFCIFKRDHKQPVLPSLCLGAHVRGISDIRISISFPLSLCVSSSLTVVPRPALSLAAPIGCGYCNLVLEAGRAGCT